MNENQFKQAVQLYKSLGETKLSSGKELRAELCLGQGISLWDVIAPCLVLYRFPLLFNDGLLNRRNNLKHCLWPYKGLVGRFKDNYEMLAGKPNEKEAYENRN